MNHNALQDGDEYNAIMLLTFATACTAAFSALCAATVAAFLVLVMTPRLHSPVRAWLRPRAVERVESGLAVVAAAQRHQRPWLTRLFQHSSHSVSVTFYVRALGGGAASQRWQGSVATQHPPSRLAWQSSPSRKRAEP